MRSTVHVLVAVCAFGLLAPGPADAYVEEQRYDLSYGAPQVGGRRISTIGGVSFAGGGRPLEISVDDDLSPVVPVIRICQSWDGDSTYCEGGEPDVTLRCLAEGVPYPIAPPARQPQFSADFVTLAFVYTGTGTADCRTAVATSGVVTMAFEDPLE